MWPYAYPSLRNTVWKNARANIGTLSIFAIIRADLDQNDLIGRIKRTTVDWIPLIWIHVLIHNWSNRLSTRKNWFVQFNHSTTIQYRQTRVIPWSDAVSSVAIVAQNCPHLQEWCFRFDAGAWSVLGVFSRACVIWIRERLRFANTWIWKTAWLTQLWKWVLQLQWGYYNSSEWWKYLCPMNRHGLDLKSVACQPVC